jgi:hypothetical protein
MSGYQFLHIESFSRKADAEGRTVDFVLAEAARRGDACQHVEAPSPPEVLFGVSVDEVRVLHDTCLAEARSTNKEGKTRKLRVDQHTLMTAILSHPVTVAEARGDVAVRAEVLAWEARSVQWLQATWGNTLVSVVRHVDEAHCHLHALILPDSPEMRARLLHPGVKAKDCEKESAQAEGVDAKTANARGDVAYRTALRSMQSDYWYAVGLPSGLARLGPARRRLTRTEWRVEQAAAVATAESLTIAKQARREAEIAAEEAATIENAAEARTAAALALECRAQAGARRATAIVATARHRAAAAQASADVAERRLLEAERQAQFVSARARDRMQQAHREARRVVGTARREAVQIAKGARRIGAWLGAIWHGVLGTSPVAVARKAAGEARANERSLSRGRIAVAEADVDRMHERLRITEKELAAVAGSSASLGAERNRLAREVARLRPSPTQTPFAALRPVIAPGLRPL